MNFCAETLNPQHSKVQKSGLLAPSYWNEYHATLRLPLSTLCCQISKWWLKVLNKQMSWKWNIKWPFQWFWVEKWLFFYPINIYDVLNIWFHVDLCISTYTLLMRQTVLWNNVRNSTFPRARPRSARNLRRKICLWKISCSILIEMTWMVFSQISKLSAVYPRQTEMMKMIRMTIAASNMWLILVPFRVTVVSSQKKTLFLPSFRSI